MVSFTFDDFPKSALITGGQILLSHGAAGTYYASLGLAGTEAAAGRIFEAGDLARLVQQGHELGCHTYAHCHAWETPPAAFERSVLENRRALRDLLPNAVFQTLSYPISCARPATKRLCAKYFSCCRGGDQTFNAGASDLNYLKAFFLEQSRDNFAAIESVIARNRDHNGWLIFATHDVSDTPTRFGCTPAFFEEVVRSVVQSGAVILPMSAALQRATSAH